MNKLILLHPADNVMVCRATIVQGEQLDIDGESVVALNDISVGHKVARRDLAAHEKVLKYGAPIGSMTTAALRGEHVHSHNMKSAYISSHTRQAVGNEGQH